MSWLDDLAQSWRSLRGSPGFVALAASVLGLGLGATIYMFGVVRGVMYEQPAYPEADRILQVYRTDPARNIKDDAYTWEDYVDFSAAQGTFGSFGGYYTGTVTLSGDGLPERYSGTFLSPQVLEVLQVKPILGRALSEEDELPNAAPVVLLGHDLWKTRFGADPDVIGRSVRVNGRAAQVIGVMPPGMTFPINEQLFVPLGRDPAADVRSHRETMQLIMLGRLREGVSAAQARADMEGIALRLAKRYPATNEGKGVWVEDLAKSFTGPEGVNLLNILLASVWFVLLIACANVAGLIFVRANQRAFESSLRVALGASRARLMRSMLGESLIVSLIGLMVGLALAAIGLHVTQHVMDTTLENAPKWFNLRISRDVALYAFGAALLAALLAGIVPAWRASRPDVMQVLRDGGRTGTGLRLSRFSTIMVITQIAMSAALLTGAGVMLRLTFASFADNDRIDSSAYLTARVALPANRYPPAEQGRYFERAVSALAASPGVASATVAQAMPGTGVSSVRAQVEGSRALGTDELPVVYDVRTLSGFFAAFGESMEEGRDFDSRDAFDALPVAIVSREFVRRHFGGADPLGRRVRLDAVDETSPWRTIVGVVPDIAHEEAPFQPKRPIVYTPLTQNPLRFATLAVKPVAGDPHALAGTIREVVSGLDPDLPVYFVRTIDETRRVSQGGLRILASIFAVFAGIAIVLASVGIYGVLASSTSSRHREIGVRRALGADTRQILVTVMRGAGVQLGVGLALGAVLSLLVGRLIATVIGDGVHGNEPIVYGVVFGLLASAALAASVRPAIRAMRVEPAVALRYE